ncbi:MAG: hypothetical protein JWQ61_210 [Collimonas fungivorans]|jgi:hypothetical protein|uniref:hypothetical protein n=1 Tax=Collimonas fungivorans TaxID=158899 RepID=UPI0026EC32D5|nr:hypothetical protein [Collimonas fungivorans]MDB5765396.1 hypothetical protein [Collimonas fungivorans]
MASISPPLPLSTRAMQAQARPDMYKTTQQQPSLLDKVLAVWSAPYKKLSGSFLRF